MVRAHLWAFSTLGRQAPAALRDESVTSDR
jgi:hypothetical protein